MLWKDTGGGDFEQPETGSVAANCIKIIDIGTQTSEYQGKPNSRRQVLIGWEIEEPMSDGTLFTVGRFYTASLSEKANLRKDLQAWRGRAFSEEELAGFDPKKLLGVPCLLTLVRNDKNKVVVQSVTKLPKSMAAPAKHHKTVFFSLTEFDKAVFDALPEGLKKIIVQSPEYKALQVPANASAKPAAGGSGFDDMADEIPF